MQGLAPSAQAENEVENPAAAGMRFGRSAVGEEGFVVAAGVFQGVGEDG
jgi:hypothetical protein